MKKTNESNLPRHDDGELMSWSWPGMYPIFYMDKECNVLCPTCANKYDSYEDAYDYEKPIAADINYEDAWLTCDNCSKRIESAYAEDEHEKGANIEGAEKDE